ncbi:MAG: hypothetical protein JXB40_04325 [Candidatus Omnitrophica bacterium]|nr:hypothetical protein [Candidatus Omnitrophota bacterium]
MKRLIVMIAYFLILSSCVLHAFAQGQAREAVKEQPAAKTVFDYKEELGLTDKQENDLKKFVLDFQAYLKKRSEEISRLNSELMEMLNKKSNLVLIKLKIYNIARLQADATCKDIETSRRVESVFSEEQLAKWKRIQAKNQKELLENAKKSD